MALKYALYRSKKTGDGTHQNPFRPKIYSYVPNQLPDGTNFWNWIHPTMSIQYVLVRAEETTMNLIDADTENLRLSPLVDTVQELQTWLDTAHTNIPTLGKQGMETDGCSVAWLTPTTTSRQLFKYILKQHQFSGALEKLSDPDLLLILRQSLNSRVTVLSVAVRNKVKNWMTARGLDSSWIVNSTTIRQVLHYIIENIDWPTPGIGPLVF